MRISDWSSDVCSSDLRTRCQIRHDGQGVPALVRTLLSAVDFLSVAHALVRLRKVSREISDQKSHKWTKPFISFMCADVSSTTDSSAIVPCAYTARSHRADYHPFRLRNASGQIGRASCRARVCQYV